MKAIDKLTIRTPGARSRDKRLVARFMAIVQERLDDDGINNNDLAGMLGLSRTLYYKKIKDITGVTPNEYLKNIRLREAARLLEKDKYSISEVTVKVGFNDPRYFRSCFKKAFGASPTEYLRSTRQISGHMLS